MRSIAIPTKLCLVLCASCSATPVFDVHDRDARLSGIPFFVKIPEFTQSTQYEVRWIEASAREYRSDVSYAVVHELLDGVVGLASPFDRDAAANAYAEYLEGIGVERANGIAPYLFRLRGLPVDPASEEMFADLAPPMHTPEKSV